MKVTINQWNEITKNTNEILVKTEKSYNSKSYSYYFYDNSEKKMKYGKFVNYKDLINLSILCGFSIFANNVNSIVLKRED